MNIAVIWASNNREKYWNKIILNLKNRWLNIFPINPKETTIEWYKCYKELSDINTNLDIVVFVVNPEITIWIIKKHKELLNNTKIWLQPWSYNDNVLDFLKSNYKTNNYIYESCIMKNKI